MIYFVLYMPLITGRRMVERQHKKGKKMRIYNFITVNNCIIIVIMYTSLLL